MAAVAAGALLLTSCGGGDDGGEDDDIAGVQTPTEDSPDPEPSEDPDPTEPTDDDRPEIDLGPDFENVYEDDTTGDPVVDAALRDLQGFEDAFAEAIVHHESDRPALRYYAAGEALDQVIRVLDGVFADGVSTVGAATYFNMSVNVLDESAATFSYCRDFSQVDTTDFETGEIIEEGSAGAPPSMYSGRLELDDDDVWQTVGYDYESESTGCE
ncbi:hypothetical protein [Streptomyces profundus]|uniref:hypothetical protein n=1 Tax=Streptomyces profundus TaxID=2867410 RepID=UPI001D168954|nr:hypothetical protein [Streptomyces sp. MA3_2.13]UED86113.1 hypothetical protein K4G22_19560 [Streptomyces sp. MA3_2.13]